MKKLLFFNFILMCCTVTGVANALDYQPTVTIGLTTHPPHSNHPPSQYFPGSQISLHVTITGNPDYIINTSENIGGEFVQLYTNGAQAAEIRINSGNTPQDRTQWFNLYGVSELVVFGTPTNVDFVYSFPTVVQGTRTFYGRFSGDDLTPASNSSSMSVLVSCAPFASPVTGTTLYPPSSSGCP
jgi:hypothetical protein